MAEKCLRWRKYQGALVQCVRTHYWLGVTQPAESTVTGSTGKPSGSPVLVADRVRDTPVISGNGRLFGILREPEEGTQSRRSVVFVNPGAPHRIGDTRISVTLARRVP